MNRPKPIPERIAARRQQLHLPYQEIAKRLKEITGDDVKWQSIQQYVNGETQYARFLPYLAEALDTTPEYLAGRTDNPELVANEMEPSHSSKRGTGQLAREGNGMRESVLDLIADMTRRLGKLEREVEAQKETIAALTAQERPSKARGKA